jgi:hypothetical protein
MLRHRIHAQKCSLATMMIDEERANKKMHASTSTRHAAAKFHRMLLHVQGRH